MLRDSDVFWAVGMAKTLRSHSAYNDDVFPRASYKRSEFAVGILFYMHTEEASGKQTFQSTSAVDPYNMLYHYAPRQRW